MSITIPQDPDLDPFCGIDPAVARRTAPVYERIRSVIQTFRWPGFAPDIDAILRLKRERNAIILAHNYQTPEIFHGVADIVGDSLALAREAAKAKASVIVLCGVHFMAETAKLLNPGKKVLIPDVQARCSLADSINAADVRLLRQRYPGVPIAAYVNTTVEVKAECNICCTSGNAVRVVESLGAPQVILLPDEYLASNVATQTDVQVISWKGRCEVHERFTAQEVDQIREIHPGVVVIAHPECAPEVVAAADYTGSTSGMIDYVGRTRPARALLVTECSMADNIAVEHPEVDFVQPCRLCPHMNRITLPKIRSALETLTHEVIVDPAVAERARAPIERMLALG